MRSIGGGPIPPRFFAIDLPTSLHTTHHFEDGDKDGDNVLQKVRHPRAGMDDIARRYAIVAAAAGSKAPVFCRLLYWE
jgi:hypothetical protein